MKESIYTECIWSIRRQDFKYCEIIVVDNRSTDNTSEIARNLGCKVVFESKKGLSYARNSGTRVAKGKYLIFMDADGIMSKNYLKIAKRIIVEKGKLLVAGRNDYISSSLLKKVLYNIYNWIAFISFCVYNFFTKKSSFFANNVVIKKGLFIKVGGFDQVYGEGLQLSLKLRKHKVNSAVDGRLVIHYSPRRFEEKGYIRTLTQWVVNSLMKKEQINYKD